MAFGGFFGGGGSSSNSNSNDNNSSSTSTDSSTSPSSSSPSSFSPSSLTSLPGNTTSYEVKQRLMTTINNQSNIINAKWLIQKINDNCFEHCVPDPGASLSSRESTCLNTCMEKYIESWNTVSKTYVARLQREGAAMGMSAGGGLGAAAAGAAAGGKELF